MDRLCVWIVVPLIRLQFPIPRLDDLLDFLHGATNIPSWIYRVAIIKSLCELVTNRRLLLILRMASMNGWWCLWASLMLRLPLCIMMTNILRPYLGMLVVISFDDTLIYSTSVKDRLKYVRFVLGALWEHKLFLQLKKCSFLVKWVNFWATFFLNMVFEWMPLRSKPFMIGLHHEIFHKYESFSSIMIAITALLKNDAPFVRSSICVTTFELINNKLTTAHILVLPDFS